LLNLKYTLIIEAAKDPNFFGFYSPELEGFSGVGNSLEAFGRFNYYNKEFLI
jgi:hypothetical protein